MLGIRWRKNSGDKWWEYLCSLYHILAGISRERSEADGWCNQEWSIRWDKIRLSQSPLAPIQPGAVLTSTVKLSTSSVKSCSDTKYNIFFYAVMKYGKAQQISSYCLPKKKNGKISSLRWDVSVNACVFFSPAIPALGSRHQYVFYSLSFAFCFPTSAKALATNWENRTIELSSSRPIFRHSAHTEPQTS